MTFQLTIPARSTSTPLGERLASAVLRAFRFNHVLRGRQTFETPVLNDQVLADIGLKPSDRTETSVQEAVSRTLDRIASGQGLPYR